jgi:ABC-type glycerol-3-phosphate transport system substrate-binding protein
MRALAAVVLALVALAGCGGDEEEAAPGVPVLTGLEQLRADFEAEAGKTRVVLLFAPT